jgi:hypothetical protein
VAYNFQTGKNKIKLLTEYESVTQKVLISLESLLQTAKQLPGFDQHLPAKCSVFPLLFGAEHYQSLEIALTNVG